MYVYVHLPSWSLRPLRRTFFRLLVTLNFAPLLWLIALGLRSPGLSSHSRGRPHHGERVQPKFRAARRSCLQWTKSLQHNPLFTFTHSILFIQVTLTNTPGKCTCVYGHPICTFDHLIVRYRGQVIRSLFLQSKCCSKPK